MLSVEKTARCKLYAERRFDVNSRRPVRIVRRMTLR
jgi:hypothetical protein